MTAPDTVKASYRTQYPRTRKAVRIARRAVVEFARSFGFAGQSLDDIEIAVGEALANAVEHGCGENGVVDVAVAIDGRRLTVEVKDTGRGFDAWGSRPHVRPPAESLRGFGTFIMRELMDEVEYSERGTRLRLVKQRPPVDADRLPALEA